MRDFPKLANVAANEDDNSIKSSLFSFLADKIVLYNFVSVTSCPDKIFKVLITLDFKSINVDIYIFENYVKKIDYSNQEGVVDLLDLLRTSNYMPIEIDENCIVGWAERYYSFYPKATKGDFIGDDTGKVKVLGEIRNPKLFKGLINPYTKKSNEKFK